MFNLNKYTPSIVNGVKLHCNAPKPVNNVSYECKQK